MKKNIIIIITILLACLSSVTSGCNNKNNYTVASFSFYERFSTITNIQLIYEKGLLTESDISDIKNGTDSILKRIDEKFNIQNRNDGIVTELMKVNSNAGIEAVQVSSELIYVLKEAITVAEESVVDGKALYDPTIGALWKRWDFINKGYNYLFPETYDPLSDEIILEYLPSIDYKNIEINEEENTVFLKKAGMEIDLGSIVKGYAADCIKQYYVEQKIKKAVIDVGGNIQLLGLYVNDENEDVNWSVGVRTPYSYRYEENGYEVLCWVDCAEKTIVTSGIYEKYIRDSEGNEYHHLLDPRTGKPFKNNVISVTVFTDKSLIADGLSTMLFGLGLENGMRYVNRSENVEAIYIIKDKGLNKVYVSDGLVGNVKMNDLLLNKDYIYEGEYNE